MADGNANASNRARLPSGKVLRRMALREVDDLRLSERQRPSETSDSYADRDLPVQSGFLPLRLVVRPGDETVKQEQDPLRQLRV